MCTFVCTLARQARLRVGRKGLSCAGRSRCESIVQCVYASSLVSTCQLRFIVSTSIIFSVHSVCYTRGFNTHSLSTAGCITRNIYTRSVVSSVCLSLFCVSISFNDCLFGCICIFCARLLMCVCIYMSMSPV